MTNLTKFQKAVHLSSINIFTTFLTISKV